MENLVFFIYASRRDLGVWLDVQGVWELTGKRTGSSSLPGKTYIGGRLSYSGVVLVGSFAST